MNKVQLQATVETLQNLYAKESELKEAIKEQEQLIKDYMDNREIEVIDLGNVIVRFTSILSNKFDTKAFKKDFADIYNMFLKQVPSKRFTIA